MLTIPTWDHKDPAAFRGATRKEILERYNTISFEDCEVAKVGRVRATLRPRLQMGQHSLAGESCLLVVSLICRLIYAA
jgi:hypothetical protein